MYIKKPILILIGLITFLAIGGGVLYASGALTQKAHIPEAAVETATTTPVGPEQEVATTTVADTTSKDSAPAFVCDRGVPDPNPDVNSPLTRGLVIQALNKRNDIITNASVDCIRTYVLLGIAADDEKAVRFFKSLTDEELLFQLKIMRAVMDDPDPVRMLHPDTDWDLWDRGSLVITEMVNGSSKGHWNAQYADGMWWSFIFRKRTVTGNKQ